jgi:hypothetical protein
VARLARDIPNWSEIAPAFDPSALYELAARVTLPATRAEIIGRALAGEGLTKKKVRDANGQHTPLPRLGKVPWINRDRSALELLGAAVAVAAALTRLLEQEKQLFQERYSDEDGQLPFGVDEMAAEQRAQRLLESPGFCRLIKELLPPAPSD